MDIQDIYNLVGDKIREIFHADTTYIVSYDREKKYVYSHYYVDKGRRVLRRRIPYGRGAYTRIIDRRAALAHGNTGGISQGGRRHC